VPVRLRRFVDMAGAGWYSADMHVHRDPADIPLVLRAEDLHFVPTITTHVWSTEVSQPWKSPPEFPVVVEPGRIFTANAQEVERIQGGPGAVILLARDLPLPFTGYELHPPSVTYTRRVHEIGGYVEGDKLFWVDTIVNAALGEIDFVELNCNHFLPRLVDTDLAAWSHWPLEFGYRGPRGFALWMMDLYYRILNSGMELPLSAGSANGVKATPVGYDRVYVRLGEEAFDYPSFMRALKQGRSFSTNGPILELDVDGRHGPATGSTSGRAKSTASARGPVHAGRWSAFSWSSTARSSPSRRGMTSGSCSWRRPCASIAARGRPSAPSSGRTSPSSGDPPATSSRTRAPSTSSSRESPWSCRSRCRTSCRRSIGSSRTRRASRDSGRKATGRKRWTCTARRARC
jgi:hypothetical protein